MIILIIIELIFVLLVLFAIYTFLRALFIRISFLKKLKAIAKEKNYVIIRKRAFFASFFKNASVPDVILKTNDTEYLIRFITCKTRKSFYHFASREYFAHTIKIVFALPLSKEASHLSIFPTFRYLPPLRRELCGGSEEIKYQTVLLFSPAPVEICYENRVLSNGSRLEDCLIYNGNGFIDFLKSN